MSGGGGGGGAGSSFNLVSIRTLTLTDVLCHDRDVMNRGFVVLVSVKSTKRARSTAKQLPEHKIVEQAK